MATKREMEITAIKVQALAITLVRESGYNVAVLQAQGDKGENYSRAKSLYEDACELLKTLDWRPNSSSTYASAREFIEATYAPDKALPEWEKPKQVHPFTLPL